MFQKILFATTASPACESASRVAFELARKYDANLYALHVFGVPSHGNSPYVTDIKTGEEESLYDPEYVSWVREELRSMYADEIEKTPRCEIDCQVGVPYREILRKARKENADAIVMGSHTCISNVSALQYRNVVGNTMQMVAKNAKCPVFIISRPCGTSFWELNTMVFATDFSRASFSAFRFAAAMARKVQCRMMIFHSIDITPRQFGLLEAQVSIERKISEAKAKIAREYVPELQGVKHEIHVWEGIPHVELLKFSREKGAELVVMAHHNTEVVGEDGFLGSMVEQVVLRSHCPVVSVNKPRTLLTMENFTENMGVIDAH